MTTPITLHETPLTSTSFDIESAQRAASDPRQSVWVNASAGSGKTTVLTRRVLRLLLDNVPPQRILCLTFTRAAAAEMIVRIMDRLAQWATMTDNTLREELDRLQNAPPRSEQIILARQLFARVIDCPGGLRIRTIHAFAQEILGRFPLEAGISPHLTIMGDDEHHRMIADILRQMLATLPTLPQTVSDRSLQAFIEQMGEHGLHRLVKDILKHRAKLDPITRNIDDLSSLITQARLTFGIGDHETSDAIIQKAIEETQISQWREAMAILAKGSTKDNDRAASMGVFIRALDAHESPLPPLTIFHLLKSSLLTQKDQIPATFATKKITESSPWIRDFLSHEATRVSLAVERLETLKLLERHTHAMHVARTFLSFYRDEKLRRGVLDYDDLILTTRSLLTQKGMAPWVLYKLDGGIDHVMVDEAQDTSRAQWDIIAALTDEFFTAPPTSPSPPRTIFVVGDEKQSIYSFQNADPEAFHDYHAIFTKRLHQSGRALVNIDLNISFRSAPAILAAVDHVFSSPTVQAGVSIKPIQHRTAPTPQGQHPKAGHVEIWPLFKNVEPDNSSPTTMDDLWSAPTRYHEDLDPEVQLAEHVALHIKSLLATPPYVPTKGRFLQAGDIMILLGQRARLADRLVRSLKTHNVPVSGVDRMRVMAQISVQDVMAFVSFVLNPTDDLNLACLLHSPLIGFNDNDLIDLCPTRPHDLWAQLSARKGEKQHWSTAFDYLQTYKHLADNTTPFAFLTHILVKPCPYDPRSGRHALITRLGEEANDPLDELLSSAALFSQKNPPSLQNFKQFLEDGDNELKREQDQNAPHVRIMTVHASKGLEAPYVLLADAARLPNKQGQSHLFWHHDLPLYIPFSPSHGLARSLWDRATTKDGEEHRRLLYVAMTRAAQSLVIIGCESSKKGQESWYDHISQALPSSHSPSTDLPFASRGSIVMVDEGLTNAPVYVPITAGSELSSPESRPDIPSWALTPHAPDQDAPILFPSRMDDATPTLPDAAFHRGRLIHRLLQIIPHYSPDDWADSIKRFLSQPIHRLPAQDQHDLTQEVMTLLTNPHFTALFGPNSRAEVPIIGTVALGQGKPTLIAGQIDRLVVQGDEVWIVDYKTNRPPPKDWQAVSPAYRQQMAAYALLIAPIYPHKKIRTFLLWTHCPSLMEIPIVLP